MKFNLVTIGASAVAAATLTSAAYIPPSNGPVTYTYDDSSSDLVYSVPDGSWTHLKNQGYNLYQKTESYAGKNGCVFLIDCLQRLRADTAASCACSQITFPNPAGTDVARNFNVKIYSTKKSDRGDFNVYCGHTLIGTGNEYSACGETNSEKVFDVKYVLTAPLHVPLVLMTMPEQCLMR
jgi:hypothetical protein